MEEKRIWERYINRIEEFSQLSLEEKLKIIKERGNINPSSLQRIKEDLRVLHYGGYHYLEEDSPLIPIIKDFAIN